MPITYPMPWANCGQTFLIDETIWRITRFEETRRAADSRIYTRELADPRWTVRVVLGWIDQADALRIQTLIEMHGSRPMWLHDPKRPGPRLDLTGSILSAAPAVTPLLSAASPSASTLTLKGLKAGYQLSIGDLIGVSHSAGALPGLYRVSEPVTANGSGVTPAFSVSPNPRLQAAANDPVTLLYPRTLMQIVPGSFDLGKRSDFGQTGMTFQAIEAY